MNTQSYHQAYLLIGSNIGNRPAYLEQAIMYIAQCCGEVASRSAVYETAAWGNTQQAAFLNQALEIHTQYEPETLMQQLLQVEEVMGRTRTERYGPRTIDIDILLFNNTTLTTPLVTIPHPQLHKRRFALQPLCDIAPQVRHPVLGKTITELLAICPDELQVVKAISF